MPKFYFTYGSDPQFPFIYGWTEIEAPDLRTAQKIFQVIHPNRPGSDALNYSMHYTEEQFARHRKIIKSAGPGCHERISWEVFT